MYRMNRRYSRGSDIGNAVEAGLNLCGCRTAVRFVTTLRLGLLLQQRACRFYGVEMTTASTQIKPEQALFSFSHVPHSRKMMIVVFGNEIQMIYQSHRVFKRGWSMARSNSNISNSPTRFSKFSLALRNSIRICSNGRAL